MRHCINFNVIQNKELIFEAKCSHAKIIASGKDLFDLLKNIKVAVNEDSFFGKMNEIKAGPEVLFLKFEDPIEFQYEKV